MTNAGCMVNLTSVLRIGISLWKVMAFHGCQFVIQLLTPDSCHPAMMHDDAFISDSGTASGRCVVADFLPRCPLARCL
ncbi:hypothetical protein TNCV_2986721 [Trichonephila clavipes]|nr:hypothetical protein TNCV_2986721 [Trichonephila clavipes]